VTIKNSCKIWFRLANRNTFNIWLQPIRALSARTITPAMHLKRQSIGTRLTFDWNQSELHLHVQPANRNTFNIWLQPIRALSARTITPAMHLKRQPIGTRLTFDWNQSELHLHVQPANRNTFNIWLQPIRASSARTTTPATAPSGKRGTGSRITINQCKFSIHKILPYWNINFQCCGSGSAWIRIHLAVLDPDDPDSEAWKSTKIYWKNLVFCLSKRI
jgi:hypothetical protein